MKTTPASHEGSHLVLLPAGLTGQVTLDDGSVVDLGPAHQTVIEVADHDQAKEVALVASQMALEDDSVDTVQDFDEAQSRKNLGLNKKKG
jgi:hypothetical protein